MSRRTFRDIDDADDDSIFDEYLADFEHFEKRRQDGRHGHDNNGHSAPRRGRKHPRRNGDDSAHRS